jgi:hypothetical protein
MVPQQGFEPPDPRITMLYQLSYFGLLSPDLQPLQPAPSVGFSTLSDIFERVDLLLRMRCY